MNAGAQTSQPRRSQGNIQIFDAEKEGSKGDREASFINNKDSRHESGLDVKLNLDLLLTANSPHLAGVIADKSASSSEKSLDSVI